MVAVLLISCIAQNVMGQFKKYHIEYKGLSMEDM